IHSRGSERLFQSVGCELSAETVIGFWMTINVAATAWVEVSASPRISTRYDPAMPRGSASNRAIRLWYWYTGGMVSVRCKNIVMGTAMIVQIITGNQRCGSVASPVDSI